MTFQRLSDVNLGFGSFGAPLKVCVVSSEFLGPVRNGGIATATSALIRQLREDGHQVTLLYTYVHEGKPVSTGDYDGSGPPAKPWKYWVDALAEEGVALEYIPHAGPYAGSWLERSWLVKEFVGRHEFDLVYFDDWQGSGYYSLLAKRVGLEAFANKLFCVITHASREWISSINDQYIRTDADIQIGLERRSVEFADFVIGPSRYLLNEYDRYGWRLPTQTYHQPYPLMRVPSQANSRRSVPIQELVFFGRLETRKGLWLFCEALDRLAERLRGKTVTFLGKIGAGDISGGIQIASRSARWPFRVRLLTEYDREQALNYLKHGARLAVMPSLADNSPCAIYECLEEGIPFVSTLGSGAEELVDKSCWPDVMVEPNVQALTTKLAEVLDRGARVARASFDAQENLGTWTAWHRHIADNRAQLLAARPAPAADEQTGSQPGETAAPLLVIVDREACPLHLLVSNLASHVGRFGQLARYLVLSTRRGPIMEALRQLFSSAEAKAPILFFDPSTIDEARKIIGNSRCAFFFDANVEMLSPFFVLGIGILAQSKPVIVTCIGAVQDPASKSAQIEDWPTGDLPGVIGIGGPVWACSPARLREQFSTLELCDRQLDETISSATFGELFMHRCRASDVSVELIPIVGAKETRLPGEAAGERRPTRRHLAAELGLAPSLYEGGAPWAGMSMMHGAFVQEEQEVEQSAILPVEPLLSSAEATNDLALWAACIGRTELALQIATAGNASVQRARDLVEVAVDCVRQRPRLNLAKALLTERLVEFGRKPIPETIRAESVAGSIGVLLDYRLRIWENVIYSETSIRTGKAAKLFFLDVPLCGYSLLTAKLRSKRAEQAFLRIRVFDQGTGEEIGETSAAIGSRRASTLSVSLPEIYGRAVVVMEFSGPARIEMIAEELMLGNERP